MSIFHVIILAVVQGLAELLPVSSSAHVVVAEKLLGPGSFVTPDDTVAGDASHRHDVRGDRLLLESMEEDVLRHFRRVQAVRDSPDLGDGFDRHRRRGNQKDH